MSIDISDLPITKKENVYRFLDRKELWTPTVADFLVLSPKIIPDSIARGFVLEKNTINNDTEAGGPDMFGVMWEWVPQVGGSMVRAEGPQMLNDIADWESVIHFPNPSDWDWMGNSSDNADIISEDQPTMVWFQTGIFERLISFMGFENAAVALIDDEQKPFVHALLDRLCDLYEDIFQCFKKYYKADVIYFHDDWGGQHAPFFSQDTVREMILPYLKRLIGFLHNNGMYMDFHSCGKIEMLVPLMIEAGVDIWSGQSHNDKVSLLKEYAGQIRIDAGPDIGIREYCSPDDVERLTCEFLDVYGPHLRDVLVLNYILNDDGKCKLSEMILEYSRKMFAGDI